MFGPRAALELRAQETILSPDSYGPSGFEVKTKVNTTGSDRNSLKSLNQSLNIIINLNVWMSGE